MHWAVWLTRKQGDLMSDEVTERSALRVRQHGHAAADCPPSAADKGRRKFLQGALLTGGGAVSSAALAPGLVGAAAYAQSPGGSRGRTNHFYIPAFDQTVHWGYFSKSLKPVVEIDSGDFVTIET